MEIPKDAFLKRTGQFWKLVVGGLVLPLPTALWGWWCLKSIRSDQPTSEVVGRLAILVAGALIIASLFASVRCPKCRVRLVRKVLQAPEGADAITTFLSRRSCPSCGYVPEGGPSGLAQEKPDFSGEWILNRPASTLSPGADAVQSGDVRIEHRDPTFRYKAAFVSESGPLQVEYELLSDGHEIASTQQGITTVSSLRWEGDVLVATWRIQRPDGEMKLSFRHELLDAGRRLRAAEQLRETGRNQDNVWMFERR